MRPDYDTSSARVCIHIYIVCVHLVCVHERQYTRARVCVILPLCVYVHRACMCVCV